jgi:hypothetical protein
MNTIAIDNLKLLNEEPDDKYLISEDLQLSFIDKSEYDSVNSLKLLEYPIYFTFHHIMNHIEYDGDLSYGQKKYLLRQIEYALDNFHNFIKGDEEEHNLVQIIADIDERYDRVHERTIYNKCEKVLYLFDELVNTCRSAGKYINFDPRPYDIVYDSLSDTESSDTESSDNDTDNEDDTQSESVYEYKGLLESAGISIVDGLRDYKERYDQYLQDNERKFIKIDFEGIQYLEASDTGEIYSLDELYVGYWNEDGDNIIWISDDIGKQHEKLKLEKVD